MTVKSSHIHKFKRLKYKSGNTIYFCALPDCNMKMAIALALGKRCICWRCGESFILDEYAIRLAKPHCQSCHQPKVGHEIREAMNTGDFSGQPLIDLREAPNSAVASPTTQPLSLLDRLNQSLKRTTETASEADDEGEI